VFDVRLDNIDTKLPAPDPAVVFELETVGFVEVFDQHTPRSKTESTPPDVMVPPVLALLLVMEVIVVVVTKSLLPFPIGASGSLVQDAKNRVIKI